MQKQVGSVISPKTEDIIDKLWDDYLANKDVELRNKIFEYYAHMAEAVAKYYYRKKIGGETDYDDYLHYAVIGLLQAIENYKKIEDSTFETYARYRIKGNVINSLRQLSEKNSQLHHLAVRRKEYIESISLESINDNVGFDGILELTLDLAYNYLLENAFNDRSSPHHQSILDYDHNEIYELSCQLRLLIKELPDTELQIVEYYYYYEMSFTDIANLLQLTKGRVSQLHKSAIFRIRKLFTERTNLAIVY